MIRVKEQLAILEGCPILATNEHGKGQLRVQFIAKMAVCCDGMPFNIYGDQYWQKGTAYYNAGKYLNADKVPYIVVPPLIIEGVDPIVLGCMGVIVNLNKGWAVQAIVGEVGPSDKIGEASCEAAERAGFDRSPNDGGTDDHIVLYTLWPGVPAVVDGLKYALQPS